MVTVGELSAPYENHLRPVLRAGEGICEVCHTYVVGDYPLCWQCGRHRARLTATADAVGYIALAVKHEQLARELAVYKGTRLDARERPRIGLAAVLWMSISNHESCLERLAGVDSFPVVTTVPSTSGRPMHPLTEIVGKLVKPTRDRFAVSSQLVAGQAVLLVDDTWTTGAHAQSAASALRLAGAGPVAILAIGRHFAIPEREEYIASARDYLNRSKALKWDWSRCCLCDDR